MSDSETDNDLQVELTDLSGSEDEESEISFSEDEDSEGSDVESEEDASAPQAIAEKPKVVKKPAVEPEADSDKDREEDALPLTAPEIVERREANIRALMDDSLDIHRKAVLPKLLSVQDAAAVVLRKPFKSPHPNAPARSENLKRALIARKQFVPWGSGKPFQSVKLSAMQQTEAGAEPAPVIELPPGIEPLILWEPPPGTSGASIRVDDTLTRFLRPHQREGVQFMFECVAGLREFEGNGCILADDMGLGKTLQGIALLWTLLNSGHEELGGTPLARRVIICCPTSLVSNWDSECTKWLNGRVRTLPLCESSRDDVIATINQFLSPRCPAQLLIVSYETFRLHSERFKEPGACDLLICDEAHRLKNDQTLTNRALDSLACRRRVLLSGTPMQNQLQEFFAMVNFCNPGVLGTPAQFRRRFEFPILAGREPDASDSEKELGSERSSELSTIVNHFILRRTNSLLSAHLPPKVVEVVCCRMTPLQYDLYCHFVQSRSVRSLFSAHKSARVLSAITSLRKLLNHPKLIYDSATATSSRGEGAENGFEGCAQIFQPGMFDTARGSRGALPAQWETMSGKFAVVARMLALLREQTKDRIVIVSNYTQTLDLFNALCRENNYPCLRLDGSTSIGKRQKLVKRFNDLQEDQYVFLLSSKAGGCGLNLVGGNRLILFDMSWNPAEDKQAAARVWRDGQQRRVYVYKFMTTGTIEEKIFQRQLSKEGLQAVVESRQGDAPAESNLMTLEELRDLFSYDPQALSSTYDHMVAKGTKRPKKKDKVKAAGKKKGKKKAAVVSDSEEDDVDLDEKEEVIKVESEDDEETQEIARLKSGALAAAGIPIFKEQVGDPKEDDLATWAHHSDPTTVPDQAMQLTGFPEVSFVFSCQVDGRDVPADPPLAPLGEGERPRMHAGGVGGMMSRRPMAPIRPALLTKGPTSAPGPAPGSNLVRRAPGMTSVMPRPALTAPAPVVSKQPKVAAAAAAAPAATERVLKEIPSDRSNSAALPATQPIKKRKSPATEALLANPAAPTTAKLPKSTAGVKRRNSTGAPVVNKAAAALAPSKRTAVLYDSDDDFV